MSRSRSASSDRSSVACNQFLVTQTSRRHLLQAGAIGCLGLTLPQWWNQAQGNVGSTATTRAKPAKACIFLFMWGGPSQLDTFDLKPNAPDEVRGPFKPISTKVPGFQICEHFTKLASHTDKIALIRSLSHDDPAHLSSGHATVTGQPAPVLKSDATPPSEKDSPHIGALVSKVRPGQSGLPSFVTLPWKAYHPAAPGGEAPGQHGGWLGSSHDGLLMTGDLNAPDWKPGALSLPADMPLDRLESRYELLKTMDLQQQHLLSLASSNAATSSSTDNSAAGNSAATSSVAASRLQDHQMHAFNLLSSPHVRDAFDLSKETDGTRERYGRNIHGQSVLMARRLVEHGVPLVTVNWHNDGKNFWDTHGDNFNRLKDELIPTADLALSTLLEDLQERGMLEETLVVWVGEFGRKPQITAANSGREHWPFCYSGLMSGGGIRGGAILGESDAHAAYPTSNPISPIDFGTTIVHALGIPTDTVLRDREGRPHHATSGRVIESLFG
jgi:hypothetical protein